MTRNRKYLVVAFMALLFAGGMAVAGLSPVAAATALTTTDDKKVTLCHAAGQAGTTKFETLTINENALGAHFEANGTPKAGHEQDYMGACRVETTTTGTTGTTTGTTTTVTTGTTTTVTTPGTTVTTPPVTVTSPPVTVTTPPVTVTTPPVTVTTPTTPTPEKPPVAEPVAPKPASPQRTSTPVLAYTP